MHSAQSAFPTQMTHIQDFESRILTDLNKCQLIAAPFAIILMGLQKNVIKALCSIIAITDLACIKHIK